MQKLPRRARSEKGATAVEYALMVGFIAAVISASVATFGGSVSALFGLMPPGI